MKNIGKGKRKRKDKGKGKHTRKQSVSLIARDFLNGSHPFQGLP